MTPRTTYDYYDADGNLTSVKNQRGYTAYTPTTPMTRSRCAADQDGNTTLTSMTEAGTSPRPFHRWA